MVWKRYVQNVKVVLEEFSSSIDWLNHCVFKEMVIGDILRTMRNWVTEKSLKICAKKSVPSARNLKFQTECNLKRYEK